MGASRLLLLCLALSMMGKMIEPTVVLSLMWEVAAGPTRM